jgi:hypothetical protein
MHGLDVLTAKDYLTAMKVLREAREPDVVIAPDGGTDYLYRWHVIPRNLEANVYLHVQVASDPERPLHDHPWDNQSVILAGGYDELIQEQPPFGRTICPRRFVGQTYHRKAEEAHRLILPTGVPYTMTLFTTGATRRDWGFWIPNHSGVPSWVSHEVCLTHSPEGKSVFIHPGV